LQKSKEVIDKEHIGYAFRFSLGGRPLLTSSHLDD
jgi:hypothetical protein